LLFLFLLPSLTPAAPILLNSKRVHLGTAGQPEWDEFAASPSVGRRLDLRFEAERNAIEATLFIRQDDVRQDWFVELNGRRLGKLFLMEADLRTTLPVPVGALRPGTNLLSIIPPTENDDILLHEISLEPRPPALALGEAELAVTVTNLADGALLPGRLTITDRAGTLAALWHFTNGPPLAVRPGVVYTGNGQARIGLQAGEYILYASRGFEWSVATQAVHVAGNSRVSVGLGLRREVATPGLVSCDTHVHTFTHSRHGDATVEERMLTLAGEGIELPIATDHNLHIDYTEAVRATGVQSWFTPVTGNEVTTPAGHFNIFPVKPDAKAPDFRITDWPTLMKSLRATPNTAIVILNHPRNVHTGFQPFATTNYHAATGRNKRGGPLSSSNGRALSLSNGPPFTFDAVELLNSSAQQSDYLLVYRDWFGLLNYGYRIVGVGSSDGHDVSRYIIGQGRTYIRCPDTDPGRLDVAAACSNLLSGHAAVSLGLLAHLTVDDRYEAGDLATNLSERVRVTARALGPSWVLVTNLALFADGSLVREARLPARQQPPKPDGEQAKVTWELPRPSHDVHLVLVATGPGVTAPFWAIPRPYQPSSTHWEARVIGSTNPIWLDADGDGQFTPARGYAREIVARQGLDPARLIPALERFDGAVAAQVASFVAEAGGNPQAPAFTEALRHANPMVQTGFRAGTE